MCEISDMLMSTTCMNVICSNEMTRMTFNLIGLTPAYDDINIEIVFIKGFK